MTLFIILFGALTCLVGLVIVINQEIVFGFLRQNLDKIMLHVSAIALRLVLGAFLVYQSDVSMYPLAIEIIGWLSIFAALFFAIIGRRKFTRFMTWALSQVNMFGRVAGVIAVAFGAFLIYAFV